MCTILALETVPIPYAQWNVDSEICDMRPVPTLFSNLPPRLETGQSLNGRLGTRFRYWLAPFQEKSGLSLINRSSRKDRRKLDCHTGAHRRWSRAHDVMTRSLLLRNQNTRDKRLTNSYYLFSRGVSGGNGTESRQTSLEREKATKQR